MTSKIKAKVKNGKWNVSGSRIDLLVNSSRELELIPVRSKITKQHNYQFNFKNR